MIILIKQEKKTSDSGFAVITIFAIILKMKNTNACTDNEAIKRLSKKPCYCITRVTDDNYP